MNKGKLDDYFTSKKIFLRPERGSLVTIIIINNFYLSFIIFKVISKQPVPAECSFGGSVQFECEGESYELLSYQWYKDEDKLIGEDKQILKLSNLTLENTGNYHCVVSTSVMREKSYVVRLRLVITKGLLHGAELCFLVTVENAKCLNFFKLFLF